MAPGAMVSAAVAVPDSGEPAAICVMAAGIAAAVCILSSASVAAYDDIFAVTAGLSADGFLAATWTWPSRNMPVPVSGCTLTCCISAREMSCPVNGNISLATLFQLYFSSANCLPFRPMEEATPGLSSRNRILSANTAGSLYWSITIPQPPAVPAGFAAFAAAAASVPYMTSALPPRSVVIMGMPAAIAS